MKWNYPCIENNLEREPCSYITHGSVYLHYFLNLCLFFIRSFLESDNIKAVISIGCCYNLLSEQATEEASFPCGFPMSEGVKSAGFPLGKSARDLACQVCKRTLVLEIHNFSAVKYIVKFVYD